MVIMASGIAHGCVCTTTMTTMRESHKMMAISTPATVYSDMHPRFIASFFDTGHPCYGQLTPFKTRYSLISIIWLYCGLKLRAHQGHIF